MARRSVPAGGLKRLVSEATYAIVGVFIYFAVRAVTEGNVDTAIRNAGHLVALEKALGIFWEPRLQESVGDWPGVVTLSNWIYIWGHWPVIIVVAAWLYLRRPEVYYLLRTAFFVSGVIGMVIFAAFPVAPPRLADLEVIDTVTRYSHAYRVLQPPSVINQYAAMPSLHFGWNLLIGGALAAVGGHWLVRLFGWLLPTAMLLAIVFTANHFIIDAVVGGMIALLSLWLAAKWRAARGARR